MKLVTVARSPAMVAAIPPHTLVEATILMPLASGEVLELAGAQPARLTTTNAEAAAMDAVRSCMRNLSVWGQIETSLIDNDCQKQ